MMNSSNSVYFNANQGDRDKIHTYPLTQDLDSSEDEEDYIKRHIRRRNKQKFMGFVENLYDWVIEAKDIIVSLVCS